ncbi:MAG: hypothetical protein JJU11_09200, partial [Candidatus Sumerlaeia bacterium]|nr:hypothetical protein [Candidatus Sumerlaeia bacterium]
DPEGSGMLAWGLQVGNQEDFVSTPHKGISPTTQYLIILEAVALAEELAGNDDHASELRNRASQTARLAMSKLYNRDLGRFGHMRDHSGMERLDGQYHSLILPVLEGLLDPCAAWQSIRHLYERLTGSNGETYLSNNFPDHLPELWATWGMQAGAAQQPWAAWGYAKVGRTSDVIAPLRAAARWVFNEIQNGTWPETANEVRPAYFSPPAALWIQAFVEAVFGLRIDRSTGTLHISPHFPPDWPTARLELPEWQVEYTREENQVHYRVWSSLPLVRRVNWDLEAGDISAVLLNGTPVSYIAAPAINGYQLQLESKTETETKISFSHTARPVKVMGPRSIATGSRVQYTANSGVIIGVDDPCGIFRCIEIDSGMLSATVRQDIMEKYLRYGRLGQMNFSRRSIFLRVRRNNGDIIPVPVDLTLLPPMEASATSQLDESGRLSISLLLRNNTENRIKCKARLSTMGSSVVFDVDIPQRGEVTHSLSIDARRPVVGENHLLVLLDDGRSVETCIVIDRITTSSIKPIELPDALLVPDSLYTTFRKYYNGHESIWRSPVYPLEDIRSLGQFEIPELPGVPFMGANGRLIPVGHDEPRSPVALEHGDERRVRKIYLLVCPFLTNHEMFTQVARIELHHHQPERGFNEEGRIIARPVTSRTLHFPGDLDWFYPVGTQVALSTWHRPRPDRHGLLRILSREDGDWPSEIARPPAFPQPDYWCDSASLSTVNAVFNVIEVSPRHPMVVERVVVHPLGTDSVLGIVAMSVDYYEGEEEAGW